ncbi:MAG: DMT family transporter [Candidatus Binatia bacterium]
MIGEGFALIAAVFWGTIPVLVRKGFSHASPSVAVVVGLFASFPLFLGVFLFHPRSVLEAVTPQAALWFAAVGVTGPCLGRLFNYMGVERLGAARATPLINSAPLFTTIFALIFLHEQITPRILFGVLGIVGGILVLTGQQRHLADLPSPHSESLDKVQDRLRDNEMER